MELVKENNPILKKIMPDFNFDDPIMNPTELVTELHKVRKLDGGIGLAAPQVGIETRVIVIGMGSLQTEGAEEFSKAFFNPEITEFNEKQEYMVEGRKRQDFIGPHIFGRGTNFSIVSTNQMS